MPYALLEYWVSFSIKFLNLFTIFSKSFAMMVDVAGS